MLHQEKESNSALLKTKVAVHRPPKKIKLIDFSNLHENFKETFCKLQFTDEGLRRRQKIIAKQLIDIYETEKVSTNHNDAKIENFKKISQQSDVFIPPPKIIDEEFSFQPWVDSFKTWWNAISWSSFTHYIQGWWTSPRLFALRDVRIEIFTGLRSATSTLSSVIRWGGLSYIISLIFDFPTIIYETFKPRTEQELENNWSYSDTLLPRFKSVMEERDELGGGGPRWYRVINDKTWFDINFFGILLLFGVFAVAPAAVVAIIAMINVVGFAIDVCNETLLGIFDYLEYAIFLDEIEDRIKQHEDALNHFKNKDDLILIREEIARLKIIQTTLQEKKISILKDRLRVVISLSLVVLGMFFVFFPPTSIIAAKIVGAGMALLFGSTGTGFVPRLWKWSNERFCELFHIDKKKIDVLRAKLHTGYCLTLIAAGCILTFLSTGFPVLFVPGLILFGSGAALLAADLASPSIPDAFKTLWNALDNIVEFFSGPDKNIKDYEIVNDLAPQQLEIDDDENDININLNLVTQDTNVIDQTQVIPEQTIISLDGQTQILSEQTIKLVDQPQVTAEKTKIMAEQAVLRNRYDTSKDKLNITNAKIFDHAAKAPAIIKHKLPPKPLLAAEPGFISRQISVLS